MVNKPSTWTRGTNIANVAANTRLGSGFANALLLITAAATAT